MRDGRKASSDILRTSTLIGLLIRDAVSDSFEGLVITDGRLLAREVAERNDMRAAGLPKWGSSWRCEVLGLGETGN